MNPWHRLKAALTLTFCILTLAATASAAEHKTKYVIFVMTDGLRWQEVFNGADESLMNKENGGVEPANVVALKKAYWRDTVQARRDALMPFVWTVMAKHGQIYGDRVNGSDAFVTNGLNFSYPGYNETLSGFPDPRVNSNDKIPNPNVTVLEWLDKKPAYHGRIAAFGAWDVFPYILNTGRSKLLVNAGYDPLVLSPSSSKLDLLNQLKAETPRVWDAEPFDPIPFHTALEYLKLREPRVLFLSLGDTDEWAHAGNYAEYLNAAHRADAYLKVLWDTVQSLPEYRGKTTLVFSPDHGRGDAPLGWKDHGEKVPESKFIWMAFMGPDTPALGTRAKVAPVTQNQIAATIAALLGEDYATAVPQAGKPIAAVVGR